MAPPLEEEKLTKENVNKFKNNLEVEFEKAYSEATANRKPQSKGTDIFGALNNLKTYFKADRDNYIVFLSDMMNYSPALNMEPSNSNFSTAKIENNVKAAPQIDLQNSTIFVLTGNQPGIAPAHFELVKSFWSKYFDQNGGKLYDYGSAGVSKLDEMMKASN
jgi:hypothetical protein